MQGPLPEAGKKWVEFDPTGLERAAKAVKELDNSGRSTLCGTCSLALHVKNLLDLTSLAPPTLLLGRRGKERVWIFCTDKFCKHARHHSGVTNQITGSL